MKHEHDAVIVAAKRTPIGKFGGKLKEMPPDQLAAVLIRHLLAETDLDPSQVDDVILGNTIGPGGNVARVAALGADLPVEVPGMTIDRQCGSGLEAIVLAARLIQAGAGHIYLAGGTESTSLAPWKMAKPATLYSSRPPVMFTRAPFTPAAYGDPDMGEAAENVADQYDISREEQDEYAYLSHQKAVAAVAEGRYGQELVPTPVSEHTHMLLDCDECIRPGLTPAKLTKMSPVFRENGTVTAGNACPQNDGAAIALVMSRQKAAQCGLAPLLTFVDAQVCGVHPSILGMGPVAAVRSLLGKQGLTVEDIDLLEFNEAFASQTVACLRDLGIPWEKVCVGGGALALGHPYAASGAILVTRLCTELTRLQLRRGLAAMGIGGGMGIAAMFAREGTV